MAKLTIQPDDAGRVVPLGGDINWDLYGSADVDIISVASGTAARLSLGGGIDIVRFEDDPAQYMVRLDGVSAVFTHASSGATVSIPMTTLGDQLSFGGGSALDLRIDTSSGQPMFMLGSQELTAEDTPVSGSGGDNTFSLDGRGNNDVPDVIDASAEAFIFTDSASASNNVVINSFGADDQIRITGATVTDYDPVISCDILGDVTIAYNNSGVLSQIVLTGVAAGTYAFDVQSFNALGVGDLVFV